MKTRVLDAVGRGFRPHRASWTRPFGSCCIDRLNWHRLSEKFLLEPSSGEFLERQLMVFLENGGRLFVRSYPMLAAGVWAEVRAGDEHLRLFSEETPLGVQASVYNVTAKNWIAPSESVDDIEQGKERAEAYAKAYLKKINLELPPLQWKKSRSA